MDTSICCVGKELLPQLPECSEPSELIAHFSPDDPDEFPLCAAHLASYGSYLDGMDLAIGRTCDAGRKLRPQPGAGGEFASWSEPCMQPHAIVAVVTGEGGVPLYKVYLCQPHADELDRRSPGGVNKNYQGPVPPD